MTSWRTGAAAAALLLAVSGCDAGESTGPVEQPAPAWDLMFHAFSGNGPFAEALVLPPGTGGFPERIFPVGRFAMEAAPSPDGARIAYVVRDALGAVSLWVADRDGGNARRVGTEDAHDGWPSWSPDGERIAFQSDVAGASDIYVVNADGSGLVRLTFDPLPGVTAEVQPAWSPDGSVIAYASNEGGDYDIYMIRPDGADRRRITTTADSDAEPAWHPAGDRLAVRRVSAANEWDIWVLSADGAELQRIARPGWQSAPSWRADGQAIAFTSRSSLAEPWQVWTMGADGGDAVQQTPDHFTGGHRPTWLRRR